MNEAQLRQVLAALVMSSPHTDRLYRWQDDSWVAQRAEAIALVDELLSKHTELNKRLTHQSPPCAGFVVSGTQ